MDFFDVVLNQRACRQFSERPVDSELVERCLEAAVHAPSAENRQPTVFLVLRDPAQRDAVNALTRRAWREGGRAHSEGRLAPAFLKEVDEAPSGGSLWHRSSSSSVAMPLSAWRSRCRPPFSPPPRTSYWRRMPSASAPP